MSCTCVRTPLQSIGGNLFSFQVIKPCQECEDKHIERERQSNAYNAYCRANLTPLECEECRKPFGWVHECDLNGSLFICNDCKEKI